MEQKKVGIIGHDGIGRSSMQAAMIHSLLMQKGVQLMTAEPEHEVIDQRGGVLTNELLDKASLIEPDAFSLSTRVVGVDFADGQDRATGIIYVKNEDGTLTRIGTTTDKLPEYKSRAVLGSMEDLSEQEVRKTFQKLEVQTATYYDDYSRSARNIRREQARNKKKGRQY